MGEVLINVSFRIPERIHKLAKIKAVKKGVTLGQYLVSLICKDLEAEKENE